MHKMTCFNLQKLFMRSRTSLWFWYENYGSSFSVEYKSSCLAIDTISVVSKTLTFLVWTYTFYKTYVQATWSMKFAEVQGRFSIPICLNRRSKLAQRISVN